DQVSATLSKQDPGHQSGSTGSDQSHLASRMRCGPPPLMRRLPANKKARIAAGFLSCRCLAGFVLPAAISTAAEAEGYAGAAAIIAGSAAVVAVRARRVVAIAVVIRPVMTVAPVAMVMVMATPMPVAMARADVG